MIESNDQRWGLCDHDLVVPDLDDYDDAEADYGDEDDDSPLEQLACLAVGV